MSLSPQLKSPFSRHQLLQPSGKILVLLKNGAGNPSFGEAKCVGFAFAIASLENKDVVEFHFKEDVFANERLLVFSDVSYRITIILKPGSIVESSAVIRVENVQKTFCIGENAVIEGNVTFESCVASWSHHNGSSEKSLEFDGYKQKKYSLKKKHSSKKNSDTSSHSATVIVAFDTYIEDIPCVCSKEAPKKSDILVPSRIFDASEDLQRVAKGVRDRMNSYIPEQVPSTPLWKFKMEPGDKTVAYRLLDYLIQEGKVPCQAFRLNMELYRHDTGSVTVPQGQVNVILLCGSTDETSTVSVSLLSSKEGCSVGTGHKILILREGESLSVKGDIFYLSISLRSNELVQ
ncbi:hypothetical protein H9L39_07930 [Fusarium oxysporum f. sp. albedinis]|uniref:Uncharacterized protein n=1 Tax=Fusarium oxysporum f. sp. cepae TaxID=396571 RepID=A0A3L6N0J6_FUSOX|nr:hypothetical protein H9L39_07930 [Fusarium oxysporum f. sp. albedinis]RKK10788.1 hypothetical protein BFJ65_g14784 [Fusarium oxysporum f. sp. cepae]